MKKECNKDGGNNDQRQEHLRANVEDINQMSRLFLRKRSPSHWLEVDRSKTTGSDAVEYGYLPDKNHPEMVAIMIKLLRQQAAPDVGTTFSRVILLTATILLQGLIRWLRRRLMILIRFIKYTDGHQRRLSNISSNQQLWVTRMKDHFLRKSMGIHIKLWQLLARKSNPDTT